MGDGARSSATATPGAGGDAAAGERRSARAECRSPTAHRRSGRTRMRYHLATRSIVATPALIPAIGLLALLTAWPPGVAGFEQAPPPGADTFTSLVASVLAPPQPVLGADDRIHLAYELFVTNPTPSTMTIEAVETLDPGEQNKVLARLDGTALSAASRPFAQDAGTAIGPGQVSRIFLDLTLQPSVPLPA